MQLPEKAKYDFYIKNIIENLNYYRENKERIQNQKIYLANRKVIDLQIDESQLPHLLGLNFDYMRSSRQFKATSSIEMLEELIQRKDEFFALFSTNVLDFQKMFSDYLDLKLASFKKNIDLNVNDLSCVIEFKQERKEKDRFVPIDAEYFIVREDRGGNLLLLALVKDKIGKNYCAMSNIKLDKNTKTEDLRRYIEHQNITYANNINKNGKNYYLNWQAKLDVLSRLNTLAIYYDANLVVSADLYEAINQLLKYREIALGGGGQLFRRLITIY